MHTKGTKVAIILVGRWCAAAAMLLLIGTVWPATARAEASIRVGIFQNKPIVYFDPQANGLFVAILDEVATREGWQVQYVPGTIDECLERLADGRIDLMTSLGTTPERLRQFAFSREPVWTFWGTVYARDPGIQGILDLQDKRIGVRRGNKTTMALKELLKDFNVVPTYVEYGDYEAAFADLLQYRLDTVAVNNTYGFDLQRSSTILRTPIVFNAFSAYFAAARSGSHTAKLDVIDRYVRAFKADRSSVLHRFEEQWMGRPAPYWTPRRMLALGGVVLAFVVVGMALWRYRSLVSVNRQLSRSIVELGEAEQSLQKAHDVLEHRVEERTADLSREIDHRASLEKELQRERDFLKTVLDNVQDGIVACNGIGILTIFNRAAVAIHGLPHYAISAEQWADRYGIFDAAGHKLLEKNAIPLYRALQGEQIRGYELSILSADGSRRLIVASAQPLYDAHGEVVGAVSSMHDVTEEREAHEALSRAHQELEEKVAERTRELQESYRSLEREVVERQQIEGRLRQSEKMEAVGTMAGGIAHDFNNLLAAILGYAELAQDDLDTQHPAAIAVEQIVKAADRAKRLVAQILAFSRREPVKRLPVLVAPIVAEAVSLMRASIPSSIDIVTQIEHQHGAILADGGQIHQVLFNLIANSAQAIGDQHGVITVRLSQYCDGGKVFIRLTVADNGCGMSPDLVKRIFDPYFTTKKTGQGTGMGLSVVHGIVVANDGAISVTSTENGGSVFNIDFPEIDVRPGSSEQPADKPAMGAGERILVVDDEAAIVEMLHELLTRLGYNVEMANGSREALDLITSAGKTYDLVITDQTMPEMNGDELARRITEAIPGLPVILCTGYSARVSGKKTAELGVSAFLTKPVKGIQLANTVRAVLDGRRNHGAQDG